jgi:hypothetical protein
MNKRATFLVALLFLAAVVAWPPVAGAAPSSATTRIRFQPGATSAAVAGQLAARGTHAYVLRASAGQLMQVMLQANAPVRLLVRGADGTVLNRGSSLQPGWQGRLPRTQDYTVQVSALDQPLSYCLRVTALARIQFAPGATSATVSSPVQQCQVQGADEVGGYVLRALAGQTMRVSIDSPNHNVYLTIVGADSVPLKFYDDWNTTWEGVLPTTQDYKLLPIAVGSDARFTLTVWVSPLGQAAPPTRIRFAPGAISGRGAGRLVPGQTQRYVLWAARGQRMQLSTWTASGAPLDISVTGPDGRVWRGRPNNSVIDPLPRSGDYVITLATRPGSGGASYWMEVTIPAS